MDLQAEDNEQVKPYPYKWYLGLALEIATGLFNYSSIWIFHSILNKRSPFSGGSLLAGSQVPGSAQTSARSGADWAAVQAGEAGCPAVQKTPSYPSMSSQDNLSKVNSLLFGFPQPWKHFPTGLKIVMLLNHLFFCSAVKIVLVASCVFP